MSRSKEGDYPQFSLDLSFFPKSKTPTGMTSLGEILDFFRQKKKILLKDPKGD